MFKSTTLSSEEDEFYLPAPYRDLIKTFLEQPATHLQPCSQHTLRYWVTMEEDNILTPLTSVQSFVLNTIISNHTTVRVIKVYLFNVSDEFKSTN